MKGFQLRWIKVFGSFWNRSTLISEIGSSTFLIRPINDVFIEFGSVLGINTRLEKTRGEKDLLEFSSML